MRNTVSTGKKPHNRAFRPAGAGRRCVSTNAVQSQAFLGDCPPHARETVDAIREAVAHSTCAPYSDMAADDTLVINPPWAPEQRSMGLSDAICGVDSQTKYTQEHIRPLAAAYETDGSVFLLWERKASYADNGNSMTEDICGATYVKKDKRGHASDEQKEHFKADHGLVMRAGPENFFAGRRDTQDNPVFEQQMVSATRQYYQCWKEAGADDALSAIASPKLQFKDPIWEMKGMALPLNRVEAAMYIQSNMKNTGGKMQIVPQAIAHSEGTNMVFAFWTAEGLQEPIAGIDIHFFGDDLKVASVASFHEPTQEAARAFMKPQAVAA